MADHRDEGPGENGTPVPRDLPDQQADAGEDPWDVDDPDQPEGENVPDTDEAGTGRQGAPHAAGVNPDQPVPDEPSA
ncbi:hypothetical protein [Streptomyces aurantiogriseus]|uniref:Uncharacterized protein n=1 Tax=Streptomyces aurantiogriseus TaxID=66870 RepID=A0A918CMG1_9ACTN|nr:hypothetical protein [Streptomyces aurantiogriseus]GGR32684.1 hypothetical protein GCM10010251_56010 [Streptomyces aurantiogriseus]